MSDRDLQKLRSRIDELNVQILALIQERADVVLQIAHLKEALDIDGFDPRREEEMLRKLTRPGSGPFGPAEVESIFRSIFQASLALQEQVRDDASAARKRPA
jgi:3-deoxy-7-phosphoheptulonate synthase/chorismate mutase